MDYQQPLDGSLKSPADASPTLNVRRRWLRFLRQPSFLAHVVWLGSGTALSQFITLMSMIVLTRIYPPADIGNWAAFTVTAFALLPLVNWRYELAIVLPREVEEAANILLLTNLLACCTAVVAAVGSFWIDPSWLGSRSGPELGPYLWLIGPQLLLMGFSQSGMAWLTRQQRFRRLAMLSAQGAAVTVLVQLALGWHQPRLIGLLFGTLAGQLTVALSLFIHIHRVDGPVLWSALDRQQLIPLAQRYRNFPLFSVPYGLVGGVTTTTLVWWIGNFGTPADRGLFSLAYRLTYAPIGLIGGALRQVFYRRAAGEARPANLEPFVVRTQTAIILLAAAPTVIFMGHAEPIFALIFDARWHGAERYAFWLAVPALVMFLTSWTDRLYDVLRLNWLALVLELSHVVVNLAATYVTFRLTGDPLQSVRMFALIAAAYNLVWLAITFHQAGFSPAASGRVLGLLLVTVGGWALLLTICRQVLPPGQALGVMLLLAATWSWWVVRTGKDGHLGMQRIGRP